MIQFSLTYVFYFSTSSLDILSRFCTISNEISKETRDHFFDVARSYGCFDKFYKEQYPQKIIAVICPEIQSEFYYRMVTCLEELLNKAGANMVLSLSHFDPNIEKAVELILKKIKNK